MARVAAWFSGHSAKSIPCHVKEENAGLESILPPPLSTDAADTGKLWLDVHRTREVFANCRSHKISKD